MLSQGTLLAALLLCASADEPTSTLPKGARARWTTSQRQPAALQALSISSDGAHMLTGDRNGVVRLWDCAAGKVIRVLKGHRGEVKAVAYSPDGRLVASGGADKVVRIWDAAAGNIHRELIAHDDAVTSLVFTPDGNTLIAGGLDHAVLHWDISTAKLLRRLPTKVSGVRCLALTRDGSLLAAADSHRTIHIWNVGTGTERFSYKRPGWVHALCFSFDGATLVSGGSDQAVHVRNWTRDGETENLGGYEGPIHSLAVDRAGKIVAAANEDGKVRLWEIASRSPRREFDGHRGAANCIALSPDERLLYSCGDDGAVMVWPATGTTGTTPWSNGAAEDCWRRLGEGAEPAFDAMAWFQTKPELAQRHFDSKLEPMFRITQRVAELAPLLNDDKFTVRQNAAKEIESFGNLAAPMLRQRLDDALSLEAKRRIEQILTRFSNANAADGSMFLRLWRLMEILESWATPASRQTLERVAKEFPDQRLREEASAALARLASK